MQATAGHVLAIEQLPRNVSGLQEGRVYLLQHDGRVPVLDVIWATLLAGTSGVHWVTGRDIGKALQSKTPLAERMRQAIDTGQVRAYEMAEAADPGKMVEELEYFGVKRNALFLFEDAVAGDFEEAVLTFKQFASKHASAVLLVSAHDLGYSDCLSGLARFHLAEAGQKWDVLYWFDATGVIAGASFGLSLLESEGGGAGNAAAQHAEEFSGDEDDIFITRAALAGKKLPEGWRMVEDFAAAETALTSARHASIILHHDQNTALGELARLVFSLRHACGRQVRILVRQVNAHLRHSQEQLLLRLGANFVIPAEVLFPHLDGFVRMLKGQVYPYELEPDYDEVVAQVMPSSEQGYLKPGRFAAAVRETLSRSGALMIRSVLVRLKPAPGLSPADALRSCWMKRRGDLCTADEENVFLFLFACRESNIDLTLDRQFAYPVSVLFEGESLFLLEEDIVRVLSDLEERTRSGIYPDITLKNPMEAYSVQEDSGWPSPAPESNAAIAIRRPLALKRKSA